VTPNNTLIVDEVHNGPPGTGNGGWTSGLIAAHIERAEVTLRQPPPLATPMTVEPAGNGIRVVDPEGKVIATATTRQEPIPAVPGVGRVEALAASNRYPGHASHHFPTCWVCGPQRPDGLRIFPGRLPDGRTASPFTTPGDVGIPTVWAALDCPGGWTVIEQGQPWVLGRFAVVIDAMPSPDDECVVVGQPVSRDGRKALVRSTLYGPGGLVLARGEATWISVPVTTTTT
jgi:hypothetical protein